MCCPDIERKYKFLFSRICRRHDQTQSFKLEGRGRPVADGCTSRVESLRLEDDRSARSGPERRTFTPRLSLFHDMKHTRIQSQSSAPALSHAVDAETKTPAEVLDDMSDLTPGPVSSPMLPAVKTRAPRKSAVGVPLVESEG